MNDRHLPASSLRGSQFTWAQVWVAGVLLLAAGPSARGDKLMPPVTVTGDPVAPPPKDPAGNLLQGAGLCGAFRIADKNNQPLLRQLFPNRPSDFPTSGVKELSDALNDFMDGATGGTGSGAIGYQTLQTPFDLASKTSLVGTTNIGDFIDTPECATYSSAGCQFPAAGSSLDMIMLPAFASRFRGFLLIPDGKQNLPIHLGFFTQDEVALRVFEKATPTQMSAKAYDLVSRSVDIGRSQWRVTNSITFVNPGLYPIEILHANSGEPAVLEMVALERDFTDFDGFVPDTMSLNIQGFRLDFTRPVRFFQTSSGALPFGTADKCQQCPRSDANQISTACSNNKGYFCNEAAVCSPCVGDQFCGSTCKVCAKPTPFCARSPGSAGMDYDCYQCRDDSDCLSGQSCIQGTCISPCACCKDTPYCVVTDGKNPGARNCTACRTDSDCGDAKCDLLNGRCVDKIPDCNTDDRCGATCMNCGTATATDPQGARPHCLNGQVCVQCRNDVDCKAGSYCRSGDCVPCTHDRHCGSSCRSCGLDVSLSSDGKTVVNTATDKPFCLAPNGQVPTASCVRCLTDANCGTGGTCDPVTHQCNTTCNPACPSGQVCDGTTCVECLTSSQCSCGQCVAGACTPSCGDSTDCRGNQCCGQETATCTNGRCKPGLTAHGGALCCEATGGALSAATDPVAPPTGHAPLVALAAALGLLVAMRLRGGRGAGVGTARGQVNGHGGRE